jgi:hypothetical protein
MASSCKPISEVSGQGIKTNRYIPHVNSTPSKAVLILPPTGGESFVDRALASSLCASGTETFILNYSQEFADQADLKAHDRISRSVMSSLNDFLEQKNESFVVIGSSLGGLYASIALGIGLDINPKFSRDFPHLKKITEAVLVVAGGDFAEILAFSDLATVEAQRTARIKRLGLTNQDEYAARMRSEIEFDTLALASKTSGERVLFFNSTSDSTVPSKTQIQLWEGWGKPEMHSSFFGHRFTIGVTYLTRYQTVIDFIQRRK